MAATAMKMSWAASRTTTCREDLAYCLLGIFNVNMPLLYGEGEKAFLRLQEEIMRQSGDLSIFAWGYQVLKVHENGGMFARSPTDFIGCSTFERRLSRPTVISATNITLSMEISYYRPNTERLDFVYADLNCSPADEEPLFLPLVINGNESFPMRNANHITNIWFERPAGVRPILIRKGFVFSASDVPGVNGLKKNV